MPTTKKETQDRWDKWNTRLKDLGIYIFGIALAYNELIIEPEVRWLAIMFIASLLSIPMVTKIEETLRKRDDSKST